MVNCRCAGRCSHASGQKYCSEQSSGQGRPLPCRPHKGGLVWPGKSAGALQVSAPGHVVGMQAPSVLAQPMASLVPPDTCLGMPLGAPPDSLHPSHAGNGAALTSPCCLSHPRSSIPLQNSLGSCHHKNGLRCSGSSTSSQATDLPTVSLFTSHVCSSLCAPNPRASEEEWGEIRHCSWAADLTARAGYPQDLCAGSQGWAAA